MDQDPTALRWPDQQRLPGSIRAARERAEAGRQTSQSPPNINPNVNSSASKNAVISRPTPMPQWPFVNSNNANSQGLDSQPRGSGDPSREAPQRPPRPSYVPSMLDASRIQDHTPAFYKPSNSQQLPQDQPGLQRYWETSNINLPQDPMTPNTGISSSASRASTGSSVGSIPDFPVPAVPVILPPPLQARRSAALGPPPSSRRGASSYYSQNSYVAPILEEGPESPRLGPHGSFASSNVMPQNRASGPSSFYMSGITVDEDDEFDGQESREIEFEESIGLVGKQGVVKSYRPALTTVRSDDSSTTQDYLLNHANSGGTEEMPMSDHVTPHRDLEGDSFFIRASEESEVDHTSRPVDETFTSEHQPPVDPRVEKILGGLEKGGAIQSGMKPPVLTPPGRSPARSPVTGHTQQDQNGTTPESRASLTSLPDLIRRATKVAANLDKGRTASRLGMLDMFSSSNPSALDKNDVNRPRNSISDMLASFPPPALNTPTQDRPMSRWPSPFVNSNVNLTQSVATDLHNEKAPGKRNRKCCGLPLWGFALLLFLLLCLIVAAIVVPVVLIILPRQNQGTTATPDLSKCASSHPCSNGGTSLVSSSSCRCICVNGFTGSSCTAPPATSECTTTDISSIKDATVGSGIPRLLAGAASNFSVPLNATYILSAFSADQLACHDENNLILVNQQLQQRDVPSPVLSDPFEPMITIAPRFALPTNDPGAMTSNGLIIAAGPTTPTTSSSVATTSMPTTNNNPTEKDLDFARVAILYIYEQTQLSTAVNALNTLQKSLDPGSFVAEPVVVSSNITVDFLRERITVGAISVGGK